MTSRLSRFICVCVCAIACQFAIAGQGGGKSSQPPAGQQTDSTLTSLMNRLDAYIKAIETESTQTKITESDFLVSACDDSVIWQKTALRLYERYMESPVMGDEAVAIHIFDTWFADGGIKMPSDAEFFKARLFAELNRNSLIGMKAPSLALRNPDGSDHRIPEEGERRLKVLYFYDTDCPVCSAQTSLLGEVLKDYETVLYAIYTGTEREKWLRYAEDRLNYGSNVVNLWDPDRTSDFEMLYGVIRTPAIFLVDADGVIIGRRLDPSSLGKLLAELSRIEDMEYGSDEALAIFGKIFAPIEDGMGCEGLSRMASHICSTALENRDTTLFRQVTGDLLYFIAEKEGENYKCGTPDFVDRFILERNDIWKSPDDTLKVINLAGFLKKNALLSPVGTRLPKVKVPAVEITPGKDGRPHLRNVKADLSKQKSTLVVFHLEDCGTCRKKIATFTEDLVSGNGLYVKKAGNLKKIILVEMNGLWEKHPETATLLSDSIDLTGIPMVIATGRDGNIARKYL